MFSFSRTLLVRKAASKAFKTTPKPAYAKPQKPQEQKPEKVKIESKPKNVETKQVKYEEKKPATTTKSEFMKSEETPMPTPKSRPTGKYATISFPERHTVNIMFTYDLLRATATTASIQKEKERQQQQVQRSEEKQTKSKKEPKGKKDKASGKNTEQTPAATGESYGPNRTDITSLLNPNLPLDVVVGRYLKKFSNIGSNNRHFISEYVYNMMRWMYFLTYACENTDLSKNIKNQIRLTFNDWIHLRHPNEKGSELSGEKKNYKKLLKEAILSKEEREKLKRELQRQIEEHQLAHEVMAKIWNKTNKNELIKWRQMFHTFKFFYPILQKIQEQEASKFTKASGKKKSKKQRLLDQAYEEADEIEEATSSEELKAETIYKSFPAYIQTSCPLEFFDILVDEYGKEDAIRLSYINNTPAPIFGRINPIKLNEMNMTRGDLIRRLANKDVEAKATSRSELGIRFEKRHHFLSIDEYKQGLFEIQDEGSQLVANLVNPKPGDLVLDLCAGAGGKSLAFAHKLYDPKEQRLTGQIYISDLFESKLDEAKKRFRRAGIQNMQPLTHNHAQLEKLKKRMDWVLLDVPCSGSGTIRRNPELKYKLNAQWIEELRKTQREIFERGLQFLRPSGHVYIVYATCSILRRENQDQVKYFLEKYADSIELVDEYQNLPMYNEMDGFYAAVFRRKYTSKALPKSEKNQQREAEKTRTKTEEVSQPSDASPPAEDSKAAETTSS